MTVEPGTTMREWNKRRDEERGSNAAVVAGSADGGNIPEPQDALLAVLERIAAALEKIAERRT